MFRISLAALLTIHFILSVPAQNSRAEPPTALPDADEQGFVSLFDGKSLTNWEGNHHWFRIQDQAIVGGRLDEKIPNNFFLCTTKKFSDFELRLEVKAIGEGVNAGVQFRTKRLADSDEVSGYQADIGGVGDRRVWGALYDESRRKKMLAVPDDELVTRILRPDDWNQLTIRCVGPHIEVFLNGEQTVDYVEAEAGIEKEGIIGLQIHAGPPSEAWYRNIRIKSL